MTRLGILVEGKTEFEFIICVLAPFLLQFGICAEPFSIGGEDARDSAGELSPPTPWSKRWSSGASTMIS